MIFSVQGEEGKTVVTLKAAGLLDLDAGEIVRPGIVRIENAGELVALVGRGMSPLARMCGS
jgi:hypothetical protein